MLFIKNLQFLPNHYETWPPWPNYELLILTKFHNDWVQIVDFSLMAYFWACVIFYYSVSTYNVSFNNNSTSTYARNIVWLRLQIRETEIKTKWQYKFEKKNRKMGGRFRSPQIAKLNISRWINQEINDDATIYLFTCMN